MKLSALLLAFILACVLLVTSAKDLYKTLELTRNASDQDIKKAFRKLSKKYHPDFNPGDSSAAIKYQDITEAHDILSDSEKRQIYDMEGYDGLKESAQRKNQPMDPFAAMFGHGGGHQGGRPKGPNAMVEIPVTLEELFNGKEVSFTIKRNVICTHCRGSGSHDGELHTCSKCHGQGQMLKMQSFGPGFQMRTQVPCDACGGRGKVAKTKCSKCSGNRVHIEPKELVAAIEKGMKHEQQIIFEKESEQSPSTTPGDVIAILKQQPHKRFRREGDDLHVDLPITLKEALLGFEKNIPQLDGSLIQVKRDKVTQPFEIITIEGQGMPQYQFPSIQGKMYVRCVVSYPAQLNDQQKEKINEMFKE